MAAQLLQTYIDSHHMSQSDLSKIISRTRQTVWNWVRDDATVELTDAGIRIRLKSGRIVHETQQ